MSSNNSDDNHSDEHIYDGIRELDNALPNWWVNLLYYTMIFSGLYFLYYGVGSGPTLVEEYQKEKQRIELALWMDAAKHPAEIPAGEEELRALLSLPARVQAGKSIFQVRCASCHGAEGQGGIGPNLTDDYWLHGGKMTEIRDTVTRGVPEKGMPPWGALLKKDEIHSVVAFIKSIRGSQPPNAKAPQGVKVEE